MSSKKIDVAFQYFRYIYKSVSQSRLKHNIYGNFYTYTDYTKWLKTIQSLSKDSNSSRQEPLVTEIVNTTVGKQPIYVITAGNGPIKVLLWARMHGDEPTATKSLIDLIEFIVTAKEYRKNLASALLENYTFVIIPVLNPDGMEKMDRYTLEGIDMNRDAIAKQTEGGEVLHTLEKKYKPTICFNLHDQQPYYSAGKSGQATSMAFLAPPTDKYDTYTENRELSTLLISSILPMVCNEYPHAIAKWNDEFEPLAFGEYMQQQGSATLLIESGYDHKDLDKEKLAEMNFSCILAVLYALKNHLLPTDNSMYMSLPINESLFFDFIIRDIKIYNKHVDIAFNTNHKLPRSFPMPVIIEEIGDLSSFKGHLELKKIKYSNNTDQKTLFNQLSRNRKVIFKEIDLIEKCVTINL